MNTPLGAHLLIINNIHGGVSTHVSQSQFDRMRKCRQFTQFTIRVPALGSSLQCINVLSLFSLRLPHNHSNSCVFGALSLASLLVVSCRPRDVVPRVFRLSPTLCVVSIRSAVSKPRIWHYPHSASCLLRSVAKSSETSFRKLRRVYP